MGKENDMAGTIGKCLNITQGKKFPKSHVRKTLFNKLQGKN